MQAKLKRILVLFTWALAVCWIAVLFFFSGQSGAQSGALSLKVTQLVMRIFPGLGAETETLHFYIRKLAHFSIFAVEGFLLGAALMHSLKTVLRGGCAAAVICCAVAVLNEFHQTFMQGRSCELRDMLIDAGGALTGIAFAALAVGLLRRRRARRNVII